MTHRERMLKTIRGESSDRIPFAPRLDLWYRSNLHRGTLPKRYKDATLQDILNEHDIGYHAVIPLLKDIRSIDDEIDRGLGIYNIITFPHRTILKNIKRTYKVQGDYTIVEYDTPHGKISTIVLYDERMREAGITISHITEYAFKSRNDYKALGYIFENAEVEKNYDGYLQFKKTVGESGIAVCYVNFSASAHQYIMRDIMPLDTFFFELNDHPHELSMLVKKIGIYHRKLCDVALECPGADVHFLGSHYDGAITYPKFFQANILPTLKYYADRLHAKGRFLLSHTDGENMGLLQCYIDSGIDITDSITPKPLTKLTYREVRDFFNGRITIMGGIPSVGLLPDTMSDEKYKRLLDNIFNSLGNGDHAILGISDTTPPDADFNRILRIKERVEAFGPVINE
jgi:hypothetical protein